MAENVSSSESHISTANEAYGSLREYVESISEADMQEPNRVGIWSGKDLVVHIADWEAEGARILNDIANGRPETWLPEGVDGDTFNERRVSDHADISLADALDYWSRSHTLLIETYRDGDSDRDDILLGLTRNHYRSHLSDFRHVKPFKKLADDERAKLLGDMDAAHAAFNELVGSVPAERLNEPNTIGVWSGKDLIAHLGHGQQAAIDLTRELENDRPGKWPGEDGTNINDWNEAKVEAARSRNLDDVRAKQQRRFQELRELISGSEFATRAAGIGTTGFHYNLHVEDFEKLM